VARENIAFDGIEYLTILWNRKFGSRVPHC
jgi:hypothetical protein